MNPRFSTASITATRTLASLLLATLFAVACEQADTLESVREQLRRGEHEASVEPLRELLRQDPENPEILFLYGQALIATRRGNLADWSLRQAATDPRYLVRAGMQLAYNSVHSGNHGAVIDITTQILEVEPENVDALLVRAKAYAYQRLDLEAALADADRLFELDPTSAEAYEPRIIALLDLDRIEEAGQAIAEMRTRIEQQNLGDELSGWHCSTEALFASDSDETERAGELWEACLEAYPAHDNVVANAMKYFDSQRNFRRSLEIIRAAVQAAPENRKLRSALAGRLSSAGMVEEARALLLEMTEEDDPQSAGQAWGDLAQHYIDRKDYASAADAVERAIDSARAVGSPNPSLLLLHADTLLMAGDLDGALRVADEMKSVAHREVVRARVAQKRGDHAASIDHFNQAFVLWPDNPYARHHAAQSYEALGRFDEAAEAYRYAIRINAGATDARIRLARFHVADGRPAEGLFVLQIRSSGPLDDPAERLAFRLMGQLRQNNAINRRLEALASRGKSGKRRQSQWIADAVMGQASSEGPEAGLSLLDALAKKFSIDLSQPESWELLWAALQLLDDMRSGEPDAARQRLDAALRENADSPELLAVEAMLLQRRDANPEEYLGNLKQTLAVRPRHKYALVALARALEAQNPERALELYDRAAAIDPEYMEPKRAAARLAGAMGQLEQAEQRYGLALEDRPYDWRLAADWARLRIDHEMSPPEKTIALLNRATRFGGGDVSAGLMAEIQRTGEGDQ